MADNETKQRGRKAVVPSVPVSQEFGIVKSGSVKITQKDAEGNDVKDEKGEKVVKTVEFEYRQFETIEDATAALGGNDGIIAAANFLSYSQESANARVDKSAVAARAVERLKSLGMSQEDILKALGLA